jgi:hypothetical protein
MMVLLEQVEQTAPKELGALKERKALVEQM